MTLGELARRLADEAGRLRQTLALQCGRVVFVVSGSPTVLQGDPM
ncbi:MULTISPECIES: bifunctional adenosylcobinamide kinase/adenosylcobinamide-phosphate guanylyltransferase [unclassified Xanthomonas]|nr:MULTISPECIES: bifunctional adenosylcobinamide kinase/adenosylcobinamide-phosphate guanylyltransferase [unclassified Xanthomonas]MBB4130910.1 adenosyl cobinamide kinase/adenosyl cobinamide phosphate guanylyltransferase [Xanthomonas sp. 3075]MBB5866296.1 adenosyl cobinamide kinase/adenosyl cobinamide phosphate guanylyltransferase [Xanthomonas sp. 3058]